MKNFIITSAVCIAMILSSASSMAQQITIVSGKVLNLPEGEKKPRPFPMGETVRIFAFNTVASARDALKALETGGGGTLLFDADAVAGADGYYEIRVAENGALIFNVQMKNELREVNYKQEINANIDGGIALEEVEVVAENPNPQPRRERRNTAGNISLTFLVGKAELDPADSANVVQMNKLQEDLMNIVNGEGTTLKEFKITGVSSPEGRYASNLALAKQRTAFALRKITSVIPAAKWSRVYKHPTETRVATWNEVADLLERDSLTAEAREIREITGKYKNPDAQFAAVSRLPYYSSIIKERLPKLRTVQYEYKHEIFRELNPDEILDKYLHDPQYADGKKSFTRYEYWHLFRMIKDPEEAEKLYRRAYRETMAYDTKGKEKPWILAANNLAIALLRRDTFDVEILKPLIDLKRKVNMVDSFNDGISITKTEVNPETIVANQLAMYIRAYNFEEASILADKLPDTERFQMIKAFANCLGGYYDYRGAATVKEGEERKKVFKLVKESSPLNNIVMCMAMETDNYNKEAQKALEELPETAMTKYMKLVIYIREKKLYEWSYDNALDFDEACKKLEEIVKLDEKYYKIAVNDGEISKEFMEYYDQGDWKLY